MAAPTIKIPYITGFAVKPLSISGLGVVTFTDGTNDVTPNQLQCEAYGYTYNKALGTCSTFTYNTNLNSGVANENNKTYGSGNSTETGTNNTLVMGEDNTVRGLSRNSIITGSQNVIANGINNANVSGTLGEATADNSIVLGGNAPDDNLAERQSIHLMYGKQTTSGSTLASNATIIPIPAAFNATPTPLTAVPIPLNPFLPFLVALSSFSVCFTTSPKFDFTSNSNTSFAIVLFYKVTPVFICVNLISQTQSNVILFAPLTFTLKLPPEIDVVATHPEVVPEVLITSRSL